VVKMGRQGKGFFRLKDLDSLRLIVQLGLRHGKG